MHLTSETLKPSGIKAGRIKVDKLTDKNKIFVKKKKKATFYCRIKNGHEQTRHQMNFNTLIYEQVNVAELQLLDVA